MAIYDGDQQAAAGTIVVRGVHVPATAANVKNLATPAGLTAYTFNAAITLRYNGAHLAFRKGQTVAMETALHSALIAAGASLTAA